MVVNYEFEHLRTAAAKKRLAPQVDMQKYLRLVMQLSRIVQIKIETRC